ncbi:hypothetical protein V6N13_146219 [Hibiscus sabdariffa]
MVPASLDVDFLPLSTLSLFLCLQMIFFPSRHWFSFEDSFGCLLEVCPLDALRFTSQSHGMLGGEVFSPTILVESLVLVCCKGERTFIVLVFKLFEPSCWSCLSQVQKYTKGTYPMVELLRWPVKRMKPVNS